MEVVPRPHLCLLIGRLKLHRIPEDDYVCEPPPKTQKDNLCVSLGFTL